VRAIDVPLLVAAAPLSAFARVLVTTDLSDAAARTIKTAWAFARLFGATVRALHVIEPLPSIPDVGVEPDECAHLEVAESETAASLSTLGLDDAVESVVLCGAPARTIADHAADWSADLVVVGSHGKGWIDRVLLGSTTERLLNRLPCSLLIIPTHGPASSR
jgi:nucleotide-binding universal stress UspA family protein